MRKAIVFAGILLLFLTLPGIGQEIDYVANGGMFYNFENEPYTWFVWDCVTPAMTIFEKDENPSKDNVNPSDSCGMFVTTTCTWEGTTCDARFVPLDFSLSTIIKVKVLAPEAGRIFMVKLEDYDNNTNNPIEIQSTTAVGNNWEEMEFDCSSAETDFYTRVVIFPDFNSGIEGEVWYFDDVRLDIPVAVQDRSPVPGSFLVASNYPNPFNPSTTIDFELPRALPVDLRVYGPTGAEVAKLVDGTLQAGRHSTVFNGAGLPSGIYVYRLRAGGEAVSGKMVLSK
ncbi:T9SS type A sorting domain-containing protein [bacterium]|nr:T9SS type A sorting domain-containing protein [bacterium]